MAAARVPAFEPVKKSSGFLANCDSMEMLGRRRFLMDPKHGGSRRGAARVVVANRAQLSWDLINPDGWLGPDHRARLVVGFVETLDLTVLYDKIEAREGTAGRPAADPAVLFALWLLATMDGVGSARGLDPVARPASAHRSVPWRVPA